MVGLTAERRLWLSGTNERPALGEDLEQPSLDDVAHAISLQSSTAMLALMLLMKMRTTWVHQRNQGAEETRTSLLDPKVNKIHLNCQKSQKNHMALLFSPRSVPRGWGIF